MKEIDDGISDLTKRWDSIKVAHKCSVQELLDVDESIPTGETLTTADIIDLVMNNHEPEEDEPEAIISSAVTNIQAKIALEQLKSYFTSNGKFDETEIDFLDKLFNKCNLISAENKIQQKLKF